MSFKKCADTIVNDGTFNRVAGSQHNYHVLVQVSDHRKGKWRALKQYREIPTGNVYLKRKIAQTGVKIPYRKDWRGLEAHRTICIASVDDKEREFLHVQYSGPNATKACKLDFEAFSTVKDINHLQLFGYSNFERLPALVFYDAFVPVSHIFERNRFSSILFTYLSYQAVVVQGFDDEILLRELWADPRTGMLYRGLYVEDSSNVIYQPSLLQSVPLLDEARPSLTLQTYSDTIGLFDYLNETLSTSGIVQGLRLSSRSTPDWPNDRDAKWILSFLPGTIYRKTSLEIVARYPGDRKTWYYGLRERGSIIPDVLQGSAFKTADGSMRFTLKSTSLESLHSFELRYALRPWESWSDVADSWLSQAHGIFRQLGIGAAVQGEYSTLLNLWLEFERIEESEVSGIGAREDISTHLPIYLFIRPIPRPCDDEDRWDNWLRAPQYYWTFNSSGLTEMSNAERLCLGLPLFTTTIEVWHDWWDRDAYDVLGMIHRSQGFDPASMELARFLGDATLKVVDGKSRFRELKGDDDEVMAVDVNNPASTVSTSRFCFKSECLIL